ncbi:unnamed protein product [Caenorhabditis sp. 36 PRJEB53466]|nr:unnamed protein product [Caenorhabditis sp. 36 PRJEB53466]
MIGVATRVHRSYCSAPPRDYRRVAALTQIWNKYSYRRETFSHSEQARVQSSRDGRKLLYYSRISTKHGCPRLCVNPMEDGLIADAKAYISAYLRNAFVHGIGIHDDKQEFLDNFDPVFPEVLRAYRDENFSNLAEFTLGGNETLNFHRKAAHKLSQIQKEALNLSPEDLLGDSGYLMKYPYLRGQMGSYIHSIDFVNADANGNTYPIEGKKGKIKVFCRYKVVRGALYQFEMLRKDVQKDSGMWSQKILPPKEYLFKWPRYTFVELDICQEAEFGAPIKLHDTRYLYDFHLFSF